MPFNLGFGEIFVILIIVLLLFGAKRIPEIAQSMGKGIREFKRSVTDVDREIRGPERDRDYRSDRIASGDAPPPPPRASTADDEQDRTPKRLLG